MAWQDVAAKIVQGAAGAAGNTNAQAEVGAWQQRKQGLEDEQRQLKQSELDKQAASGAISPVQWGSATSDLYAHEPAESRLGRLKRGAERIVGMKKQADAQKQQADAKLAAQPSPKADYASIQASAKTPDQLAAEKQKQAISTFTQEGDIQNTQKSAAETQARQSTLALIDKYITDPEANQAAKQEYTQKQAGILSSPKNLPGQAGQPYEFPQGSGRYVRDVQQGDGTIGQQPMSEGWKPAAPKMSMTPRPGMSGGKNAFALLTDQGWVDAGTRQPLKDFKPAPTFAQTGLFEVIPMQTPSGITYAKFDRRSGGISPIVTSVSGQPIPPSVLSQLNQSIEPAIAADTRLRVMQANKKDALAGNQQAMLSLLSNHLGMTSGAQKGIRISQAQWNEAMASAPWVQRQTASWFHQDPDTGEYVFDGYKTGVTLSPEQINQMVDLAQQRRDAQWKQVQEASSVYGGTQINVPPSDDVGGGASKGPAPRAAQSGGGQHTYAIDSAGKRHKVLDSKAQLPQGWKWAD